MQRWLKWTIIGVVAAVALFYGAVLIYTNFINKPEERLSFEQRDEQLRDTTTTTPAVEPTEPADTDPTLAPSTTAPDTVAPTTAPVPVVESPAGTWIATQDSELGYRVKEVLGGISTEGVGRTNSITGSLVIEGTTVTSATFAVDMASVISDSDRRDGQFRGRIMDVETHPTATFVLIETLDFGSVPEGEDPLTAIATGELTLRGNTNTVTFEVEARRVRGSIEVLGDIPIIFEEYGIPNPSFGPASTEDNGLLEFLLVFQPTGS